MTSATINRTVAAFDFDGTLTHRDSLLPFLLYTHTRARAALKLAGFLPLFFGYAVRLIDNGRAKEMLLQRFFADWQIGDLRRLAREFAVERLPLLVKPAAIERFYWHRQQGHTCVLVSASLEDYLLPWAHGQGFDHVIASRLELDDHGAVTGRLAGGNCYGSEKLRRLEACLGDSSTYKLYAYGDSRGDRELLQRADFAFYRTLPPATN